MSNAQPNHDAALRRSFVPQERKVIYLASRLPPQHPAKQSVPHGAGPEAWELLRSAFRLLRSWPVPACHQRKKVGEQDQRQHSRRLRVVPRGGGSWPVVRPTAPAVGASSRLRLTTRGQVVICCLLLLLSALGVLLPVGTSRAGEDSTSLRVRYLVVQEGQTLWGIARQELPDTDPRDAVLRIQALNALDSAQVRSGQRLAIPNPP